MNFRAFLPKHLNPLMLPLSALAVAGLWLSQEQLELSKLRLEIAESRVELAHRSSSPGAERLSRGSRLPATPGGTSRMDPARVDWQGALAGGLSEGDGRHLAEQIAEWSAPELIAALDRIGSGDPLQGGAGNLVWAVELALAEKDPAALFERFGKGRRCSDGGAQEALVSLAKKDPAAALAWLDRQDAAGRFDPANPEQRSGFEGMLLAGLAQSDPAAAARRLEATPVDERVALLSRISLSNPQEIAALVELARGGLAGSGLPPEAEPRSVAHLMSSFVFSNGWSASAALLDRVAATPAERVALAETVAGGLSLGALGGGVRDVSEDDLRGLRDWMATQAPDRRDELTGTALVLKLVNGRQVVDDKLGQTVLQVDPDGSGGLLVPFLRAARRGGSLPIVASLVDHVADPAVRRELGGNP